MNSWVRIAFNSGGELDPRGYVHRSAIKSLIVTEIGNDPNRVICILVNGDNLGGGGNDVFLNTSGFADFEAAHQWLHNFTQGIDPA